MMKKLSIQALQVIFVRAYSRAMKIRDIGFIWIAFILVLNCFMNLNN